jgi:hypothetical protein
LGITWELIVLLRIFLGIKAVLFVVLKYRKVGWYSVDLFQCTYINGSTNSSNQGQVDWRSSKVLDQIWWDMVLVHLHHHKFGIPEPRSSNDLTMKTFLSGVCHLSRWNLIFFTISAWVNRSYSSELYLLRQTLLTQVGSRINRKIFLSKMPSWCSSIFDIIQISELYITRSSTFPIMWWDLWNIVTRSLFPPFWYWTNYTRLHQLVQSFVGYGNY